MLGNNVSEAPNRGKKRKKRSFVQKQKRFAKQGSFGRGTELPPDVFNYFVDILKIINTKKDDAEEMSTLASTVFSEIQGKEADYCCNQIISGTVERILPFATDEAFYEFITKFSENLRPIFGNPYGSHVLQQTIVVALMKYQKLKGELDNKLCIKFYDYILKVSKFLFNNLNDFIQGTYSNTVGKTVFNVLSGNPVKGDIKIDEQISRDNDNVPDEFKALIKDFIKNVVSMPQFDDLCKQPATSVFLQSLLLASKCCKKTSTIIKRIISYYESDPVDLTNEENQPFIRLLEVALFVASPDIFKELYKLIFKKKLVKLAVSKSGNFAVQKLILNCQEEVMFGKIFGKLSEHMEEILEAKHTGILLALVKSCRRLELMQSECMTMLKQIFQIQDNNHLVPTILSLTKAENLDQESSVVTLHGCLIVQELLHFKKPINVVKSLLEFSDSKLVGLLCDVKGCHITDAFVKSSNVGEKSRDRLFKKLKGHYCQLAMSHHGSRSMDAIWSVMNVVQKAQVAEELKMNQSELSSTTFGKFFAKKIHLDNFRRDKEEWIQIMKSTDSAHKLFADLISVNTDKKENMVKKEKKEKKAKV